MKKLDRFVMWLDAFIIGFCIPGVFFLGLPENIILLCSIGFLSFVLYIKISKINGCDNNN